MLRAGQRVLPGVVGQQLTAAHRLPATTCTPAGCAHLQAVRGKPMSKDEVELLYRVFDTNKDGFLELTGERAGGVGSACGRRRCMRARVG